MGEPMNPLLDRCIVCGNLATKPGSGMCIRCEIEGLISLGFDWMMERIRNPQPAKGKRLTSKPKITKGNYGKV